MKTIIIITLFLLTHCLAISQNIQIVKISELEGQIKSKNDTTYIYNFWATWCKPCVEELPIFDSIANLFQDKKVKVILICMNFKEDLETKVLPFLKKKNIKQKILLLDEVNGNNFIPIISKQWTGAIPATLLVNNYKKRNLFFEQKLTFELLKNEVDKSISK